MPVHKATLWLGGTNTARTLSAHALLLTGDAMHFLQQGDVGGGGSGGSERVASLPGPLEPLELVDPVDTVDENGGLLTAELPQHQVPPKASPREDAPKPRRRGIYLSHTSEQGLV